MALFGRTIRIENHADWAVQWLRDGRGYDTRYDLQNDRLLRLYLPANETMHVDASGQGHILMAGHVLLMCGTTAELQKGIDVAVGDGIATLGSQAKSTDRLWLFFARKKIRSMSEFNTVTVVKILNINQYYKAQTFPQEASAHGWKVAQTDGLYEIGLPKIKQVLNLIKAGKI